MFNSLSGTLTAKLPASLRLATSGIEWDIAVPSLSLDAFGPVGSEARVFTWLYHREDQMRLFGFASECERELFLDLMKVEGIGPKQALKILSSVPAGELEAALDSGDLARLQAAPGVGTKTAQKMILALKGKLTYAQAEGKGRGTRPSAHGDVVEALAGMGFDRKAACDAVDELASELASGGADRHTEAFEKELFRRAIVRLSS
ncbi:MAG TPA: Holliday junction branch migration protein RuvA [Treponemataceae bacterium]|nr:Holliday junction branch migration protein RuvA [Treponemataceae bacterium]